MAEAALGVRARGARGEELAAAYLQGQGWDIVARNVRSRRGEVDLVAGRDDLLAFVEVKAWDSYDAADLEYAIGPAKRRRIRDAARLFLARRPDPGRTTGPVRRGAAGGRSPPRAPPRERFHGVRPPW